MTCNDYLIIYEKFFDKIYKKIYDSFQKGQSLSSFSKFWNNQLSCGFFRKNHTMQADDYEGKINYYWPNKCYTVWNNGSLWGCLQTDIPKSVHETNYTKFSLYITNCKKAIVQTKLLKLSWPIQKINSLGYSSKYWIKTALIFFYLQPKFQKILTISFLEIRNWNCIEKK